jgi:hypothetical protein
MSEANMNADAIDPAAVRVDCEAVRILGDFLKAVHGSLVQSAVLRLPDHCERLLAENGRLRAELERCTQSAVAAERERAADVAVTRAEHHRAVCPPECRCADGWHIAEAIREGGDR